MFDCKEAYLSKRHGGGTERVKNGQRAAKATCGESGS